MLALQQHFSECASCEAERRSIRQVKTLLRALHQPRPHPDLPVAISARLAEAEQPLWRVLSFTPAPRPQRGRRLAASLALSCLTVLSFAATCFAPTPQAGRLTSSGFLLPLETPPAPMLMNETSSETSNETNPALLSAAPRNDFLGLTEADALRYQRMFIGQYETPAPSELRLSPLSYETSAGYSQGEAAFAAYRTR